MPTLTKFLWIKRCTAAELPESHGKNWARLIIATNTLPTWSEIRVNPKFGMGCRSYDELGHTGDASKIHEVSTWKLDMGPKNLKGFSDERHDQSHWWSQWSYSKMVKGIVYSHQLFYVKSKGPLRALT